MKKCLAIILTAAMLLGGVFAGGVVGLADNAGYSTGDIISYGQYPQSEVTDKQTLAALNAAVSTGDWRSYGYYSGTGQYSDGKMTSSDYMRYADVEYNGGKYRAVTFDSYRPYHTGGAPENNFQQQNGYETNTVYWFKYEPLNWRVLDPASGLAMCDTIIDSQEYNNYILYDSKTGEFYGDSGKNKYASDWENSSIRRWLNNDFYHTAFSAEEKNNIKTSELSNKGYYTLTGNQNYKHLDSADTKDKIFLLSYDEVINTLYGFNMVAMALDPVRKLSGTDYAKCQGLYVYSGNGASSWLLRSPGGHSGNACYVGGDGHTNGSSGVGGTSGGAVPALKLLNLASNSNSAFIPGDVDGDGKLTSADARLALRASVGLAEKGDVTKGSAGYLACDVDADGKVTSADARLILRASVGLEDATKFGKKA